MLVARLGHQNPSIAIRQPLEIYLELQYNPLTFGLDSEGMDVNFALHESFGRYTMEQQVVEGKLVK